MVNVCNSSRNATGVLLLIMSPRVEITAPGVKNISRLHSEAHRWMERKDRRKMGTDI